MQIEQIERCGVKLAVISSDGVIVTDPQSALDLAMSVKYETGASKLVLTKESVCPEFFVLSTGIAGEILQKFINYHFKAAFYGDYSHYTSKPLQDFMRESNRGQDFFFTATKEESIQKLTEAP